MTLLSNSLSWEILKSHSSFLVKNRTKRGEEFSVDPLNLTNRNTRTSFGAASNVCFYVVNGSIKAVGVSVVKGKKYAGIRLLVKNSKNDAALKPTKAVASLGLRVHAHNKTTGNKAAKVCVCFIFFGI